MSQTLLKSEHATGAVVRAFGNLLQVKFEGDIQPGEVAMVELGDLQLKAEVIEIIGDEAKIQVYEDTSDIKLGSKVNFTGLLLEAELGPGLLSLVVDGLQNPLEAVAKEVRRFFDKSAEAESDERERNSETNADSAGNALVRTTGTDYSALVYNKTG